MDDRNRQINELEQRKREQIAALDELLVHLGGAVMGRIGDSVQEYDAAFEDLAEYRNLLNAISDSEAAIQTIEEQLRRFRELEENIETKEQTDTACSKELAVVYGRLGKLLLDESAPGEHFAEFCAPYRDQAESLLSKVVSLENRLAGLEEKEGGNVFSWIGKGAQGMVLRSFLTKAQANLELLRRTVGERYSRGDSGALLTGSETDQGAITDLAAEIEQKRADARAIQRELTELIDERKAISSSFNAEGGPLKQIQSLKNRIAHARGELKTLYRRIGAEAALIGIANGTDAGSVERRPVIDSLLSPEDGEALDNAAAASRQIHEHETDIQKLQASLAIDEEKSKIEKYRRQIQEKKDKIAQAEKSIGEFEEQIRIAEANIEKLQGDLHGA